MPRPTASSTTQMGMANRAMGEAGPDTAVRGRLAAVTLCVPLDDDVAAAAAAAELPLTFPILDETGG